MTAKGSTAVVTISHPTAFQSVYEVAGVRVADVRPTGQSFHVKLYSTPEDYLVADYRDQDTANDLALRHALKAASS